MNSSTDPENLESMLAEHLGGEMSAQRQIQFEAMMRNDPALAAEAASLRQTVDAVRSLADEGQFHRVPGAQARPGRGWALAKYAAIVALAFLAGFAARGGGGPAQPSHPANNPANASNDRVVDAPWEQRAAEIYSRTSGPGSMGRSLIALSQSADTRHR